MATGNTLIIFHPLQSEPPAANYATLDTRNNHVVGDFDDTTDETLYFTGILPRHYGGGGITVYIHYAMTSATSGKVRWDVAFERIGDGSQDIDADGFAAAKSVNVAAVDATSGNIDIAAIAFSDGAEIDSIAVGETFRVKVTRSPSDATNDTATGDTELIGLELKET